VYKRIDALLEGPDDVRFFRAVLGPILQSRYDYVQMWQYAGEKRDKIKNYLRAIKAMKADSSFLTDINNSPCVTAKKETIHRSYRNVIAPSGIFIVVREIESWYLAGLGSGSCKELGIPNLSNTDGVTEEQFNELIPRRLTSRIDFMIEILKRFSVETAKRKNKSLQYFMTKLQAHLEKSLT
jgi:hypothetical protein